MQNLVDKSHKTKKKKKTLVNKPKKNRATSATKKEKQAKKSKHRGVAFGRKKEAKKLAQGMIHRNNELQLLGCEVKEEKLLTPEQRCC